jgi:hypothetical protein
MTPNATTRLEQQHIQLELAQDLIPLDLAAGSLYSRVYSQDRAGNEAVALARLDHLAAAIASQGTLYTYDAQRPGAITKVDHATLLHGRFCDGGKMLAFNDGRPPLHNLAVVMDTLGDVLALLALKDQLEAHIAK